MSLSNQVLSDYVAKTYAVLIVNTGRNAIESVHAGSLRGSPLLTDLHRLWKFIRYLPRVSATYLTPSQSALGLLRFFPIVLLTRLTGRRAVSHFKGNNIANVHRTGGTVVRAICRVFVRTNSACIALTKSLKKEISEISPRADIRIVDNFVQPEFALSSEDLDTKMRLASRRPALNALWLSNIIPSKGIYEVMDAVRSCPTVNLKVAGAIARGGESEFRRRLGTTTSRVEYVGFVDGREKAELLAWADVYLLPTEYPIEGQPISLLEALLSGCIVLSTNYKGIPDSLPKWYHHEDLFVNKEGHSVRRGLERVIENIDQYRKWSVAAHGSLLARYSVERFGESVLSVVRETKR